MTTGAPSDPLSLVGKTLAGHFLVQRLTAEGRTSLIYRGEHVGPKRPVALKCLKITLQLDAPRADTFLKRLREETRAYSQVARNEPHFVRSVGTGMTATSNGSHVPYSVLEWLDGFSLAQDLAMRAKVGEPARTVEETAELLAPVARALAAAHAQKVLHGDMSSNNVFLSRIFGDTIDVKVLDFGVARVVRDVTLELSPSGSPPPTNDPFWSTSPGYAAPEQEDRSLGEVGTWSDVYSLAVVFMETLAGKLIRNSSPLPSAVGLSLPETVEKVFERALMKPPKERWPTAGEFWAALEDSLRVSAVKLPSRPPAPAAPEAQGGRTIRILTPIQAQLVAATTPKPFLSPAPSATAAASGKATIRMGSPVLTPDAPRVAPKPMVPAAGSKAPVPAAPIAAPTAAPAVLVAKPPVPTPGPKFAAPSPFGRTAKMDSKPDAKPDLKPATKPETRLVAKPDAAPAVSEDSKPIIGTPVLMAQPMAVPETPAKAPERKVAPPLPTERKAPPAPIAPPPPVAGAVIPVAPGPVPPPPPPSSQQKLMAAPPASGKSSAARPVPAPSEQKSVSAAAPAKSAGVFIEDLPSIIIEGAIPQLQSNPRGADTIRLNPPQNQAAHQGQNPAQNQAQNPAPIQMVITSPAPFAPMPPPPLSPMNAPGMPQAPAGLPPPPLVARPGVIIMPPGAPPSSRRRESYDERRANERKRIYLVVAVSFLVAFLAGGAFLLLHVMRAKTAASASGGGASTAAAEAAPK